MTAFGRVYRGSLLLSLALAACGHTEAPTPGSPSPSTKSSPEKPKIPETSQSAEKSATAAPLPTPSVIGQASAAPVPEPPPAKTLRPYRVAALGDSITDYRSFGGAYLRHLEKACPKSTFANFGKGGDMTNQMRRRYEAEIVPRARAGEFDTLVFYGGVNDLYSDETAHRTNDKIKRDILAVFASAKEIGLRVVVFTVSPWGGFSKYWNERRGENTRLLNSFLLGLPNETPKLVDVVVDTYPLLSCGVPTHLCADYQRNPPDGIHPGPRGHELIFALAHEKAFGDCE